MTPHRPRRPKVIISYSHQDRAFLKRLRIHLKPVERDFGIEVWDDTTIQTGSKWREEIQRALDEAVVAILLISADFLSSDFIAGNELPPLLRAAEQEGTMILPIILSHCTFKHHEGLSEFQAFNDPDRPLSGMPRSEREAVFKAIAERVTELLNALPPMRKPSVRPRHSRKVKSTPSRRQPHKTPASQPNKGDADRNTYPQSLADTSINPPPDSGRRRKLLMVIPVICLIVTVISIFITAKQSGNKVWSIKPTALAPTYLLTQADQADAPYRVAVEKGGTARLFDGRLLIHLDALSFDKESGQYFAAFRFSSAKTEDLIVRDAKPSRERFYFYPADGRFTIQLVSTNEHMAVFSFREKEK